MKKLVFIQDIDLNASPRVRDVVRDDVVEDYAAAMRKKEQLPAVVLFLNKSEKFYLLADGWHRIKAAILNKQKAITAEVKDGGYDAALMFALVANNNHGLRRSVADKKQCIATAIKRWPDHSNVAIAKVCVVDDHLVGDVRKQLEGTGVVPVTEARVATDGKLRSANRATRKTKPDTADEGSDLAPRESPRKESAKPVVIKDSMGFPIPEGVVRYWHDAGEVYEMIGMVKSLRRTLTAKEKEEDIMFGEVNMSSLLADLERAEAALGMAVPYAVCTQCQGHPETQPKNQCRLCYGRGLISKFRWKLVPEEIRAMREKGL